MMGQAAVFAALAVILSAIVRIIRTDANWKAVDEGYAGSEHLRALSGVMDPRALQDIFGPPQMDGVHPHVTRRTVLDRRRLTGWLMGDIRLDAAALAIAVLSLFLNSYTLAGRTAALALAIAVAYEIGGWVVTSMMMGRKG